MNFFVGSHQSLKGSYWSGDAVAHEACLGFRLMLSMGNSQDWKEGMTFWKDNKATKKKNNDAMKSSHTSDSNLQACFCASSDVVIEKNGQF